MRADFTTYKFRAHTAGILMTGVKPALTEKQKAEYKRLKGKLKDGSITDRQTQTLGELIARMRDKPELSRTVKTHLEELHKSEVFDRNKEIESKYLRKGISVEEDSITIASRVLDTLLMKNSERRDNEFFTGECDNSVTGMVRDFKSAWDYTTFPMHSEDVPYSSNWWQLQVYMDLWGVNKGQVIYTLVNTPEHMIEDEKRRQCWKLGLIDLPEDLEEEIERNMRYDDIPEALRVRVFEYERDDNALQELYKQCERCRKYMKTLSERLGEKLMASELG